MSKDQNIDAQERFGAAVNSGDFSAFYDVVAPDCVDHDPAPVQGPGPEGFRDLFTEMRAAFPDLQVEVEHLTATDDEVAIAYSMSGTHEGLFQGFEATGRHVKVRGVQIGRFEQGRLVERWGSSDQLGILTQIGAVAAA